MIETKTRNITAFFIFITFLLLPLASYAATMSSQSYSIDSGRVGTDQIFSSGATSQNYGVGPANNATASQSSSSTSDDNSSDNDDHDSGGHKKNKHNQNIAVVGNPRITATTPAGNDNQSVSPSPEQLNPNVKNQSQTNAKLTNTPSTEWKGWTVAAIVIFLMLLAVIKAIKKYRRKLDIDKT